MINQRRMWYVSLPMQSVCEDVSSSPRIQVDRNVTDWAALCARIRTKPYARMFISRRFFRLAIGPYAPRSHSAQKHLSVFLLLLLVFHSIFSLAHFSIKNYIIRRPTALALKWNILISRSRRFFSLAVCLSARFRFIVFCVRGDIHTKANASKSSRKPNIRVLFNIKWNQKKFQLRLHSSFQHFPLSSANWTEWQRRDSLVCTLPQHMFGSMISAALSMWWEHATLKIRTEKMHDDWAAQHTLKRTFLHTSAL